MKTNLGKTDRLLRVIAAVLLSVLYFTGTITGLPGMILLLVGGALLATAFLGFCGLYTLLGINTCKVKQNSNQ